MFVRIYSSLEAPFEQNFESLLETLASWPGMFAEPDGSWVWVYEDRGERFQLDGMIYDRAGTIEYLEIKGTATPDAWAKLLQSLVPLGNSSVTPTHSRLSVHRFRIHDIEQQCWKDPDDPTLITPHSTGSLPTQAMPPQA